MYIIMIRLGIIGIAMVENHRNKLYYLKILKRSKTYANVHLHMFFITANQTLFDSLVVLVSRNQRFRIQNDGPSGVFINGKIM